ncbi:MAG: dipeptide epimerase, partial [Proteobacteria bacterium]|nr:dipeptide epimerase [Pseudomonadota bacterium]
MPRLIVRHETWPLSGSFTISRGTRTTAEVVVAEISVAEADGREVT